MIKVFHSHVSYFLYKNPFKFLKYVSGKILVCISVCTFHITVFQNTQISAYWRVKLSKLNNFLFKDWQKERSFSHLRMGAGDVCWGGWGWDEAVTTNVGVANDASMEGTWELGSDVMVKEDDEEECKLTDVRGRLTADVEGIT